MVPRNVTRQQISLLLLLKLFCKFIFSKIAIPISLIFLFEPNYKPEKTALHRFYGSSISVPYRKELFTYTMRVGRAKWLKFMYNLVTGVRQIKAFGNSH